MNVISAGGERQLSSTADNVIFPELKRRGDIFVNSFHQSLVSHLMRRTLTSTRLHLICSLTCTFQHNYGKNVWCIAKFRPFHSSVSNYKSLLMSLIYIAPTFKAHADFNFNYAAITLHPKLLEPLYGRRRERGLVGHVFFTARLDVLPAAHRFQMPT